MIAKKVFLSVIEQTAAIMEGQGFRRIAKSRRGGVLGRRFRDGWHAVELDHHRTHGTQSCSFHVRYGRTLDVVSECLNNSRDFNWQWAAEMGIWMSIMPSTNEWTWTVLDTTEVGPKATMIADKICEVAEPWFRQHSSIIQERDFLLPCLTDSDAQVAEIIELAIILKVLGDSRLDRAREILTTMRSSWPTDTAAGIYLAKLDRYVPGQS